jgi:hypothetical protein
MANFFDDEEDGSKVDTTLVDTDGYVWAAAPPPFTIQHFIDSHTDASSASNESGWFCGLGEGDFPSSKLVQMCSTVAT